MDTYLSHLFTKLYKKNGIIKCFVYIYTKKSLNFNNTNI